MAEAPKENQNDSTESNKASTLNVLCAICSEFFINTDIIYSTTKCGHVFHRPCLLRWLKRSNTCPQCRAHVHQHNVHRLYLNFSQPTELDDMEVAPIKSFEWLYIDDSVTPEELAGFALNVGVDKEGDAIYAARVYLEDDLLPAYYVPKKKGVYAAWNCQSHFLTDGIEILHINNDDDAEYKWVEATNGEIPANALASGYCESGETLYTAKAEHKGRIRCGKLHPSHGCAYFPYKDKEVSNRNYEILTRVIKSKE